MASHEYKLLLTKLHSFSFDRAKFGTAGLMDYLNPIADWIKNEGKRVGQHAINDFCKEYGTAGRIRNGYAGLVKCKCSGVDCDCGSKYRLGFIE